MLTARRVWRYQRGNQNPHIEEQTTQWPLKIPKGGNQNPYIEEQTTQWQQEKVQTNKQQSTKHTYKTKDQLTRTPLKIWVNSCVPEGLAVPAPLVAPVWLI